MKTGTTGGFAQHEVLVDGAMICLWNHKCTTKALDYDTQVGFGKAISLFRRCVDAWYDRALPAPTRSHLVPTTTSSSPDVYIVDPARLHKHALETNTKHGQS